MRSQLTSLMEIRTTKPGSSQQPVVCRVCMASRIQLELTGVF